MMDQLDRRSQPASQRTVPIPMNPLRAVAFLLMAFALSGCASLALGYINKLQNRVTVVERGGRSRARPIELKPGEILTPGFGPRAERIDIIGRGGQILAHYRTRDIPR